ncbi:MAG: cell wall-active antibiotics response protein [Oscillospiraceae bacterium]|nr:cell wall-active antibiotics response protein [Oscillospiraceae bacterium]
MGKKSVYVTYKKSWKWGWGVFLLLAATLVLSNQFGGFVELGVGSMIAAALAAAFLVQCLISLNFGSLPIPIAALYYIFQVPLELPIISFWPLVLVTVLTTSGLYALLPKTFFRRIKKNVNVVYTDENGKEYTDEDKTRIDESGDNNNPHISVQFGGVSRYLNSNCLETAELDCSFGSLEVYFDSVELSPDGAEVFVNCKFGNIELYVPKHWHITNNMNASLGNAEVNGRNDSSEDAPKLTVTGNVSLGNIEVNRIK